MTEPGKTNHLRGLTIEDLPRIRKVSAPLLSPDNDHLVYQLTLTDFEANEQHDHLVLQSMRDGTKYVVGRGVAHSWSPDSKELLYESEGMLCIFTLHDRSTRLLCRRYESSYFINHLALYNCSWSPDGATIAFTSTVETDDDQPNTRARVIDHLMYKTKGGRNRPDFADGNVTHIYLIPVKGGQPELLTDSPYNNHSICWSPDSRQIAFISNRAPRPDDTQQSNVWKIDTVTRETTRLTDHHGHAYQPVWAPDGRHIAFLATSETIGTNDSPAADTHVALVPAKGGEMRYLTKTLDRRTEHIRWHPSANFVYFVAGNLGSTLVYRVHIDTREIEIVQGSDACISEFCLDSRGENLVFLKSGCDFPGELFQTSSSGTETIQLTNENGGWISAVTLQNSETFWFESFDKTPVQGWLMRPVDFRKTQKYPLLLVIHGGPHNMFGYDFDERMQLLIQAGNAVVYINPRGSHGYGQAFSNGTLKNWGQADYEDLMAGVDYILEQNEWLDEDRLGVTGQSYGGYMTNLIITRTTRFRAAVTDGGISNLVSFAGTSLYHSLIESEFGGRAAENFDLLWKCSPLRNIAQVTTPTLILHGETDNEVPVTQAEEMYIALNKNGVSTRLVIYAGEGHGWRPDLSPQNKADLYERMGSWFETYLNTEA